MIQWISSSLRTEIKEIIKVVDLFKNHIIGVINAMAKRLNEKIQEIKMCKRSYRKFENLRNAILLFYVGLKLYLRN
jgi:transposase